MEEKIRFFGPAVSRKQRGLAFKSRVEQISETLNRIYSSKNRSKFFVKTLQDIKFGAS